MAIEIERKFLIANDSWRKLAVSSEILTDGLIAASDGRKVRVRMYANRATLTVKTQRVGPVRAEFEYEIPIADAEEFLNLCSGNILVKTRHCVPYKGFVWEIDEYGGLLNGVLLAEVELENVLLEPQLPEWVGAEVTDDPRYRKINMVAAAQDAARVGVEQPEPS